VEFLQLPYPPSVNHYYRCFRNRMVIDKPGRAYRAVVCALLQAQGTQPMDGPLRVEIAVFPPDKRRRDLDNILKSLLDALQHAGAYHDDSQIEHLMLQKVRVIKDGRVEVTIRKKRR
jgi:crossover junction endodeoxyribonuclease RusA